MRSSILLLGLFFGFIFSLVPGIVFARLDSIPGSRYTSARAAALGDAMLPVGDDVASGLFLNPSDLSRIPKATVEVVNFSIYGNPGYVSSLGTDFYQVTDLSQYQSKMQQQPGTRIGAGGALALMGGFRNFGIGLLAQSQFAGEANADASISTRALMQFIPAVGGGFKLLDGVFRFGVSVQWVNQSLGSQENVVSPSSYFSNVTEGSGFSVTAAAAVVFPMKALPSLNIVARNMGGVAFGGGSLLPVASPSSGTPPMEAMSFDASFSIQPHLGHGATLNLMLVDRDFTDTSGITFMGHIALGAELVFKNRFFLRGGWRGGYPSAGFGLRNRGTELALTWFTEEIGSGYLGRGDTKYLLQYQLSAF